MKEAFSKSKTHLFDLEFNRKPMAVPTKPPLDMVAGLMCPAGYNVFDRPRKNVPIVG